MKTNEEDLQEPDYNDTPFQNKCGNIMNEISTRFKNLGFYDTYMNYFQQKSISLDDVCDYIYKELLMLNEYDRNDLNQMWKMLSTTNSSYVDYRIGEIVHEQLMKIWFPEEK